MEKLTRTDAQGRQRFYWIEIAGNKYRSWSHLKRREPTASSWTYPRKQGLRSPAEQVEFEVRAIYKKRKRLGWRTAHPNKGRRRDLGQDPARVYLPMLARKYPRDMPAFPVDVQPKLDGIRCLITRHGLWTRKATRITSVPQIEALCTLLPEEDGFHFLDGEIYLHGYPLHYISGLARRKVPDEETQRLQFHCFDIYDGTNDAWGKRKLRLPEERKFLKIVPTYRAEDQEDLDFLHRKFIKAGYEGSMIRRIVSAYEFRRSPSLVKRKDFHEQEYRITGIREGNGAWRGACKAVDYVDERGQPFESGVRGDVTYLRDVWRKRHEYIGTQGTVRYFNLTPDKGIPFLPVTVNFRWDKK